MMATHEFIRSMGPGNLYSLVWAGSRIAQGLLSLFAVLLTCMCAAAIVRCWRKHRTLAHRLAHLSHSSADPTLIVDADGKLIECNDAASRCYGYASEELRTASLVQLRFDGSDWQTLVERIASEREISIEETHLRKDGSAFPVQISLCLVSSHPQCQMQMIVRDVSPEAAAQRQIKRLKDVYAALSQTNQSIVRVATRDELFRNICEIAIRFCHFKLAWIGLIDEATSAVLHTAAAGESTDYLSHTYVSVDPVSPYSGGPVGRAILTNQPIIVNDLPAYMHGKPWKNRAELFGLLSCASFPLHCGTQTIGALTLYSNESDYFSSDLIELLGEMASDISFALNRIEEEKERKFLQAELARSNATIQGVLEGCNDVVSAIDANGRFILCNHAHKALFHREFGFESKIGMTVADVLERSSSNHREYLKSYWTRALSGERFVTRWSQGAGERETFYESQFGPLFSQDGNLIGAFHVGSDVTAHRRMELELEKLKTAVEQSPVTVIITDAEGRIEYANPAFTATSGYTLDEVRGKTPRILKSDHTAPQEYETLWACIKSGQPWSGVFRNKRKDGQLYWEECVIAPVRNAEGAISHFLGIKQDVTMRKRAQESMQFLASHDPLTRLPNRRVIKERTQQAIADALQTGCKSALLYIDVDHFKSINDSLGHAVGDRVLQAIVERFKRCIRTGDTLSRLAADEFLIILSGVPDLSVIQEVAKRILEEMVAPINVNGLELSTTVSIGVAMYPDHGGDFDVLLRQADLAMHAAKKAGRNAFRLCTQAMETDAHEYHLIRNGLRKALDRNEFKLYFQPQIDLSSGQIVGAESLIRWQHPELGLVAPGRFISVAEESGLIIEIGDWVLHEACRQLASWHSLGVNIPVIAVNLSAVQFKRGELMHSIRNALSAAKLDPRFLEVELTESILIEQSESVQTTINELKALGVSLALDDFGTGYSSFAYLRNLELDRLKIDQSFVRGITSHPGDEAIVQSIVQLAKSFRLKTVAEGVESADALEILRRIGCDEVQGYYFAKPMPAAEFVEYMRVASISSLVEPFAPGALHEVIPAGSNAISTHAAD